MLAMPASNVGPLPQRAMRRPIEKLATVYPAVQRLESVPVLALCALQSFNLPGPLCQMIERYLVDWQHVQPITDGAALNKLGVEPGPVYKKVLEGLRADWLDGKISTYEEERVRLAQLLSEP